MLLLWKEQKKSKGAHLHIEASAHSHYACEKSNIWRSYMKSEMTIGYSQQEGIKNISNPLSALVCHRELLLSSQETPVDFWFQDVFIPDLTRVTAWRMGCERKSGHACGFWYQGRPERRLTWNETGKESHFTFGIGSLLIAFYCILMCADDDDDDDDI